MAQATEAKEVDTILKCSICLTEYRNPKQLPCLHTFCFECLKKYCDNAVDVNVPCPLCKTEFNVPHGGVDAFPDNGLVTRLILQNNLKSGTQPPSRCELCEDEVECEFYCIECRQSMCSRCKRSHLNTAGLKNHKVVGIEERWTEHEMQRLMSSYCSNHSNKEMELYCCDCSLLICVICKSTSHSKHICKAPKEVIEEKKDLIEKYRRNIETALSDTSECIKKLHGTNQDFLRQASSTESLVKTKIANMKRLLDECEYNFLENLGNIKKERLKEIESQQSLKDLYHTELDSFLSHSRMVIERGTECEIIRSADELRKRAEELLRRRKENTTSLQEKQLTFVESPTPNPETIAKLVGEIVFKDPKESHISSNSTIKIIPVQHNKPVKGISMVADRIYVVRENQSQVNVYIYDSHDKKVSRVINIPDMTSPQGLAGCAYNRALYISDEGPKCIHRVDLTNNSATRWRMSDIHVPCGLSVTAERTLLVTVSIRGADGESRVVEYTSEGKEVREIKFDRSIKRALQTVQMSSDQFIVSHACSPLHRICVINAEGQIIKSYGRAEGRGEGQLAWPQSLAIDENSKHVFVADCCNQRVLMFDPELTLLGQVHAPPDLTGPCRLYFDSSTDRLFISEGSIGRLLIISPPD